MKNYLNISKLVLLSFVLILGFGCNKESYEPTEDLIHTALKGQSEVKFNFTSSLKGSNEVPARETKAAGHVSVKINKDEQSLYYKITAANIDDVRAAHFHLAPEGANGAVVVTLYTNPDQPSGPQNGVLTEGVITADNLQGDLAEADFATLIGAIRSGGIYVNVHTSRYPSGELRAQL
ncbi:CHRD domain-containing protein [Pricia sp.]|uniref:CHRD domain-containing protein n=1 Tax=Pricia sp. TaxID=2268138 RepID=UPI003593D4FC